MATVDASRPITRDDIEAKLREIQGTTEAGADAARGAGLTAAVVGLLLAVVIAYLLGRRRGRKRRTVVEIRRV
jgi:peptide deformylase